MERGFALVGLLFFTAPVAQIYRYFRASDAVQRQQIKWVVLGLAVTVPPLGIALVLYSASGSFEMGAGAQVGYFLWTAFLVIFPLSITISILRYRLWDIDLIIRKTLVYGVLSALLALVYFGSVVVLQALFDALIGSQSPVIIVLSTLLMAALFSPLRRQVQHLIDRRFFRSKYDATQALARFAKTARDEVEFEALTAALVSVVQETMQPDGATVWLRNVREGRKEIQWQQFGEVS
jgi:hypothetical protein